MSFISLEREGDGNMIRDEIDVFMGYVEEFYYYFRSIWLLLVGFM